MAADEQKEQQMGLLNLIVFVLSVYVLGALLVDTVVKLPPETSLLLTYIDHAICVFFFVEFCVRFYGAKNKLAFMRWGWIDLVSSIPAVNFLRRASTPADPFAAPDPGVSLYPVFC
jgi:voltage-gated potassium channel